MSVDEFTRIHWSLVASLMAGRLASSDDRTAVIKGTRFGTITLHDNGGELQVVAERPTVATDEAKLGLSHLAAAGLTPMGFHVEHQLSGLFSLPYTAHREVTSVDVAVRLTAWLDQKPIDWDLHEPDPEGWPNAVEAAAI